MINCISIVDQAWRERDAALLRDQQSQTKLSTMREKLDVYEKEAKSENKNPREE